MPGTRLARTWRNRHRLIPLLAAIWLAAYPPAIPSRQTSEQSRPESPLAHMFGFDVSYPQCPNPLQPPGLFGIVGITGGRPFTINPCVWRQYGWAAGLGTPALYVNVAFGPSLAVKITAGCRAEAPAYPSTRRLRVAWEVGCSEASYAVLHAPGRPLRWWLDVETANSWAGHLRVNRSVIEGAVTFLIRHTSSPVGIYSTPRAWRIITGPDPWAPATVTAGWLGVTPDRTRQTAPSACSTGFSPVRTVMVQYYALGPAGIYDADYAC